MAFNRFDEFRARVAGDAAWNPATSNLYGVSLALPNNPNIVNIIDKIGWSPEQIYDHVNLLSSEVTIPSRQLTTGESRTFGAMTKYVTGTTFSEITCSFLMTKDMSMRIFFERWMNYITDDTSNFVMTPDQYMGQMRISKWENGSNVVLRKKDNDGKVLGETRLKQCTGNWVLQNVFPFNISTMTFNNEETTLLKCDVSFYYERYRFDNVGNGATFNMSTKYVENEKSLSSLISDIQLAGGNASFLKSIQFE